MARRVPAAKSAQVSLSPKERHAKEAGVAKDRYVSSKTPGKDGADWNAALRMARREIAAALRASAYLSDVAGALEKSGLHMRVFRYITAPPISQDQFALVCPAWRKASEKSGATPLAPEEAASVAKAFDARRSVSLTTWLNARRAPFPREIRRLLWSVAPLIANQQVVTLQRNRAASDQENAVVKMLEKKDWSRRPASLLDTRAALPLKHFMHKTRFATATSTAQEVDIALGLRNTVVLATECKVSNDETNSVKRINDVLKKAAAWKDHWGSFVKTAALLQGVVAPKDVARLIDAGVEVFWSHDLDAFEAWIDEQT